MTTLIAYVPVIHEGYIRLFNRYEGSALYVMGRELVDELLDGHKEIRAVAPRTMSLLLARSGIFSQVRVLTPRFAKRLPEMRDHIVMPGEQITRHFADAYLPGVEVEFSSIFLRWDEASVNSSAEVNYDRISTDPVDRQLMGLAIDESSYSIDWWRHVGGYLVKDGRVVKATHNQHVPSEEAPYAEGDPRDFVEAGAKSEIATTLHVEQALITWAAREGIKLEGCDLYLTTFPCPMCAKQVAYSGIKRIFFAAGHASLDGERILRDQGVEIILVR